MPHPTHQKVSAMSDPSKPSRPSRPSDSPQQPVRSTTTALSAAEHSQGNPAAAVTLIEYGDYECPASQQAEPVTRYLVDTFGERLRFIYRHYPLVEAHPNAEMAAEAAEAAAAQGQFWPMHHLLYTQPHQLKPEALAGYAQSVGLDMLRYKAEMADRIYLQRVQEHRRAAALTGLRTTPAFFLNGEVVDVSFGIDKLEAAVLAALGGA